MLFTRRFVLKNLLPAFVTGDRYGTAIVMRQTDRRILYVQNPEFAARALLPPASTVKPLALFTLMAAGKLNTDDLFWCPRRLQIEGHSLNCIHPAVPLPMNVARALAYSCNGAVAHFASRFALGELEEGLTRFGLASPSGLTKGVEACGRVARTHPGVSSQLAALGEVGIVTTPLALLLAYSRLANRLQEDRFHAIREGLEGAVAFGTAQAAQVKGLAVAGKTGSIVLESGSAAAWFAGFAPSREPRLIVVVLKPGRSGGSDAVPLAADLLRRYL